MYKIIFQNPENETERRSVKISEFEAKRAILAKKNKEGYMVPTFGFIDARSIVSIKLEQGIPKELPEPLTRFSKQPPTKREWQALVIGAVYTHPHKIIFNATPDFLKNIVKSLWNLNNNRTAECMEIGENWLAAGKDFRMLMNSIASS